MAASVSFGESSGVFSSTFSGFSAAKDVVVVELAVDVSIVVGSSAGFWLTECIILGGGEEDFCGSECIFSGSASDCATFVANSCLASVVEDFALFAGSAVESLAAIDALEGGEMLESLALALDKVEDASDLALSV